MDIGFLRETRKRADLSQEQMAPLMDLSRTAITKLEKGDRALKFDEGIKWMQIVGARIQATGTTSLELGVAMVNGVDILALAQTLTQFVGGVIRFF